MIIISTNKHLIVEDQLCFILYACSKEVIKRYKVYLQELDLTYTQYLAMIVLWNEDNIPAKELGRKLYLDSGTTTPLLRKLESKGLVERVIDENDARFVLVKVTQKGYELKARVMIIPDKIRTETEISLDEANKFIKILKVILEKVNNT